jgi:short subunit fatty acids transporter
VDPSALTFAIVLTLIVAVLALIFTDAGPDGRRHRLG